MKRTFLTFVIAVMLTASLTACTTTPSDTNHATGNGNGSVMDDATANSRARSGGSNGNASGGNGTGGSSNGGSSNGGSSGTGGSTMSHNSGRYYADESGDVFGGNDGIGNDIGRAAGDMMNGMGNAVQDMTR